MTAPDRSASLRAFFAAYVAAKGNAQDARIEAAFAAVPREDYAGPGPWSISIPGRHYVQTPTDDVAFLYQDTLVAIDAKRGINIGEPSLHALCLDCLQICPGETVLQVGAGVGYYTAILAHLVGALGHVEAREIEADLAERAAGNLKHLPKVSVLCRSGLGPDLPATDVIYVNAGLPDIPSSWLHALRPGGRLLFPLQPPNGFGGMLRIARPAAGDVWPARFISRAAFIGCRGGPERDPGRRLARAFAAGGWNEVASLHIGDKRPADTSCWLQGEGWWLSCRSLSGPIILPGGDR